MTADEHNLRWPVPSPQDGELRDYLMPVRGPKDHRRLQALAAYLVDAPAAPLADPDACDRTHLTVRLQLNRPSDQARAPVHRIARVFVTAPWAGGLASAYETCCGLVLPFGMSIRGGWNVTCGRPPCAATIWEHERPVTVVRPSGPCHGGAAKKTSRPDATGNSVAIRPDRDPFQSVKNGAVNSVNGQSRSHVATAGGTTPRTTSPARAGRPSEGEHRVMESAAADVLTPPARAGRTRQAQRPTRRG